MKTTLLVTLKLLQRDLWHGEFTLLVFSLVIATASLSSVGFLIERVHGSMTHHAEQLNGAQLILRSSTPVPSNWLDKATDFGLEQAEMQIFSSMLMANDEFKLATIKAVSTNFPLLGELRVNQHSLSMSTQAPKKGMIWVDKRLSLFIKQEKWIELGESKFQMDGILQRVPGQSSSLFSIAPTAMIALSDLAATEVVQMGSRIDYLYFFADSTATVDQAKLPDPSLDRYQQWLQPLLISGQSLHTGIEDLKAVNASMIKAGQFLSLAALLTVILSAIAIAINSHRYGQKQYKNCAILLCLGCSEKQVRRIELFKLIILASLSAILGIALGYIIYMILLSIIAQVLPDFLANMPLTAYFSWTPIWMSLSGSLFLLLSLSMAYLSRLNTLSPLGLIRKEYLQKGENKSIIRWFFYLLSGVGLCLLSMIYTGNIIFTLLFYLLFFGVTGLLFLLARIILKAILLFSRKYQWINRLSLLNLERHQSTILLQITTFGLIFSLVMIVFLIRTELLSHWQQQFPQHTPNHFVINIQNEERIQFTDFLDQENISSKGLYPMVRGRLVALNSVAIDEAVPESARDHNALHRELNLSYQKTKPLDQLSLLNSSRSKLSISTQFISKKSISIESTLAKALNIQRGDQLTFQIGSRQLIGQVNEIRHVNWDSFEPNFYLLLAPEMLENYPMTWIASFYLATEDKVKLNQLMEQLSGVTIIEVDEILKEIQFMINRVSDAIELIFIFILISGLLILMSSLSSTLASRMYENAVIRTLGASAKQLRHYLMIEFILVALLSSLIAIVLAEISLYVLYHQLFQLPYTPHPVVWFVMILISLGSIIGLGLWVVNKIFTQSVHLSLQQFSE
jgi:putative ABC transport system permease protein